MDISDLERKTVIPTNMPLTNQPVKAAQTPDVRICNCTDAHVYLLCALGRVSLVRCRGCTLFIGGCVSLSLINCENVLVHAVARVCRVTNWFDTHLCLYRNSRPQIVGENRGLVFDPYNAVYPRVSESVESGTTSNPSTPKSKSNGNNNSNNCDSKDEECTSDTTPPK